MTTERYLESSEHGNAEPVAAVDDEVRDAFISHASEDKDSVARPLAVHLRELGHSVWFAEYELLVGDSLSEAIDRGLSRSRFGVVILSRSFFAKDWPRRELKGMVAKEMIDGERVILPVWHEIDARDVASFSLPLADMLAVRTSAGLDVVAVSISTAINRRSERAAAPRAAAVAPRAVGAFAARGTFAARVRRRAGSVAASLRPSGVLALIGLTMVAVGFLVAPAGQGTGGSGSLVNSDSVGALTVSFPAGWRSALRPGPTPGLRFGDPIALSASRLDGALVLGMVEASDRTLLPDSLLALLPGAPKGEAVRLGRMSFYRYPNVRPRGSRVAETIYALPTTADVVVAACQPPPSGHVVAVRVDCERILSSLSLASARPLPLGPQPAYAAGLSSALAAIDAAQRGEGARLATAKTPVTQALAAGLLEHAYRDAAETLRHTVPGPVERPLNAALLAALTGAANGYAEMSAGATRESGATFRDGRDVTRRALRALSTARSELLPKAGFEPRAR
jgi:TIR domain